MQGRRVREKRIVEPVHQIRGRGFKSLAKTAFNFAKKSSKKSYSQRVRKNSC